MVHDRKLDRANIDQFKTLILPNIAALSDEQCGQLEQFVQRGGGLVATHETSLYNEWGERRKDFGLAKLFGAKFEGKVEAAYAKLVCQSARPASVVEGTLKTRRASSTGSAGCTALP